MALTLDGTNGIVSSGSITTQSATGVIFSDSSSLPAASSPFGLKNRIINGDMVIDQRNAGASVNNASSTIYTLDRWNCYGSSSAKFSIQQNAGSVTPPTGFVNYLGITSLASTTPGSTDEYLFEQRIEGLNVSDLAWGTASAKTVTLSFWVRSSLTGTFGGSIQNSAQNRAYVFSYTISSANTWEQKTVTIAGDTSGTWLTTNGVGLRVRFDLGSGSTYKGTAGSWGSTFYNSVTGGVNVIGTNGATFYITGVQLERNTTATPFEWLPYGTEKALCQRYFELMYVLNSAYGNGTNGVYWSIPVKVSKRATPTTTIVSTDSPVNVVGSVTTEVGGTANAATESIQLTYTGAPATGFTRVGANITISAEL